jgi:hypothetical protein
MPVIATPVAPTPSPGVNCVDQPVKSPATTLVDGVAVAAKVQAVEVVQGQEATIVWTMKSTAGDAVDLTMCSDASVVVRIREALSMNSNSNPPVEIAGGILTPESGTVNFQLTSTAVAYPGISNAEIGIIDTSGKLVFSNSFYLVVNRGQFGPEVRMQGPPTVAEVRLHLRDSDPADNLWLGVTEFDLAEIAACIERPIHYFNESQPPIKITYTTASFPSRYFYLEAIIACLYQLASLHYSRTHLAYQQQGGLMVDDKNKAAEYAAIGKEKWNSYVDWVLRRKVQINAMAAISSVGSPYYSWGRRDWR